MSSKNQSFVNLQSLLRKKNANKRQLQNSEEQSNDISLKHIKYTPDNNKLLPNNNDSTVQLPTTNTGFAMLNEDLLGLGEDDDSYESFNNQQQKLAELSSKAAASKQTENSIAVEDEPLIENQRNKNTVLKTILVKTLQANGALTSEQALQISESTPLSQQTKSESSLDSTDDSNTNNYYDEESLNVFSKLAALPVIQHKTWRKQTLEEMTERDWRNFREEFRITTQGTDLPPPLRYWNELSKYHIPPSLLQGLVKVGYKDPTPIQRMAMPVSLCNRDVLARAETGSGKTCSFLIPVLSFLNKKPRVTEKTAENGPYALILAPVRELVMQIYTEAMKFSEFFPPQQRIKIACIIGGGNIAQQTSVLQSGVDMIIATPGRFMDVLQQHIIVLKQCSYLILDEADRMLDEGFEVQVKQILSHMPSQETTLRPHEKFHDKNNINSPSNDIFNIDNASNQASLAYRDQRRRTMLYSATFTPKVIQLAHEYMQPNAVTIETGDTKHRINKNITQQLIWCKNDDTKKKKLLQILREKDGKVIIFCARKQQCDILCDYIKSNFNNNNIRSPIALHGDASDRENVLKSFRDGYYNTLIATDVAGRGIDVKDINLVINYELPDIPPNINTANNNNTSSIFRHNSRQNNPYQRVFEAYTHRVGRTGRGVGNTGTAVTFFSPKDSDLIPWFKSFLRDNGVTDFPREFNSFTDSEIS